MLKPRASNVMHSFALHHTKLTLYTQRKYFFPAVLPGKHIEVEMSKGEISFYSAIIINEIN